MSDVLMELTANTRFRATLTFDDERTGYKAGMKFWPKGVYFNGKNVILVGSKDAGNCTRISFRAAIVKVEVVL